MGKERFSGEYIATVKSLCDKCAHRSETAPGICLAYPKGIPNEFLLGLKEHRKAVDGDGGIFFKAKASK